MSNNTEFAPTIVQQQQLADEMAEKREYLYMFRKMEEFGYRIVKRFTMSDNLDDMRFEYYRLKKDQEEASKLFNK